MTTTASFRLPALLVLVSLVASLAAACCSSRFAFKPCNVITAEPEPGAADTTDGEPGADSTG
jgi:hypothetical protein